TEYRNAFIAASAARESRRLSATKAKPGRETTSSETMRVTRSLVAGTRTAPAAEPNTKKVNFPPGTVRAFMSDDAMRRPTTVPARTTSCRATEIGSTTYAHCEVATSLLVHSVRSPEEAKVNGIAIRSESTPTATAA